MWQQSPAEGWSVGHDTSSTAGSAAGLTLLSRVPAKEQNEASVAGSINLIRVNPSSCQVLLNPRNVSRHTQDIRLED